MTKKRVLLVSGVVTIVLISLEYLGTYKVCRDIFECTELLSAGMLVFLPFLPLFLFSLVTYKMSEVVFQAWWRFTRLFVPIAMLLILVTPAYTHNWLFPVVKGTVAVVLSALYVIIASVSIILAHRRLPKN